MKQGEHFSVVTSIRLRNALELRMKGSVLTSEDSLTPVLRRPAYEKTFLASCTIEGMQR